jgi:hypothetical protein
LIDTLGFARHCVILDCRSFDGTIGDLGPHFATASSLLFICVLLVSEGRRQRFCNLALAEHSIDTQINGATKAAKKPKAMVAWGLGDCLAEFLRQLKYLKSI